MVVVTHDVDEYLERALDFLLQGEVENNMLISAPLMHRNASLPFPWLAVCMEGDSVKGTAVRTGPGHRLLISKADVQAVAELAIAARNAGVASNGFMASADHFSLLADSIGIEVYPRRRNGLYRLTKVVPPKGVEGHARLAVRSELDMLAHWVVAFGAEVDGVTSEMEGMRNWIEGRFNAGGLVVWVVGERVVSLANMTGKTPNTMKINAVYTPPEMRGNGYASACVADASKRILDLGLRHATLYTDLSNPISNRIYQNIGYEWVGEYLEAAPAVAT